MCMKVLLRARARPRERGRAPSTCFQAVKEEGLCRSRESRLGLHDIVRRDVCDIAFSILQNAATLLSQIKGLKRSLRRSNLSIVAFLNASPLGSQVGVWYPAMCVVHLTIPLKFTQSLSNCSRYRNSWPVAQCQCRSWSALGVGRKG